MDDRLTDVNRYIDEWARMMVVIWRERIQRLSVVHSGALHESLQSRVTRAASGAVITLKFLQYGIYQCAGTGNGYKRDNGGDLMILNREYRASHGLDKRRPAGPVDDRYMTSGKPRKKRDWKSRAQYSSRRALVEDLSRIVGQAVVTSLKETLEGKAL